MSKKIVFFDIDGTIYEYKKGIPKDIPGSIEKLRANGILTAICTGRTRVMIFDKIYELGFDALVAGGGTYVEYDGKILIDKHLENDLTDEVINLMKGNGFIPVPEGTENIYFDMSIEGAENDSFINLYRTEISKSVMGIEQGNVIANKVSGRFTEKSNLQPMYEKLKDRFTFVNHNNRLIELIPKGFSKATGIELLINEIGIKKKKTYAFGDSFNDFEMLKYVEHGIAVGNADPELKKHIKKHTGDIFENGITDGLKELGLIWA